MSLHRLLQARAEANRLIRVGLIGVGEFGAILKEPVREGGVVTWLDLEVSPILTETTMYKVRRNMEAIMMSKLVSGPSK